MRMNFDVGSPPLPEQPVFRILVFGDFDPVRERGSATRTIPVDHEGFAAALERIAPELTLDIPNLLTHGSDPWWLRIGFRSLADFAPAEIIRRVPELGWIDRLRGKIADIADGRDTVPSLAEILEQYRGVDGLAATMNACREAIAASSAETKPTAKAPPVRSRDAAPRAPSRQDDDVERILDLVDIGTASPSPASPPSGAISHIISGIGKGARGRRKRPAFATAHREITDLLSKQVGQMLRHPALVALEQTWRGLKFLVDRADLRSDVRIEIVPCAMEQLTECLKDLCDHAGQTVDAPVGLVVGAFELDHTQGHLSQLAAWAQAAQTLHAPLLLAVDQHFLGFQSGSSLSTMSNPGSLIEKPEFAKWNSLRQQDALRWVSACFNGVLLRTPYLPGHRGSAGITQTAERATDCLWGLPVWAVAARVAAAQARYGWPTEFTGAENGRVEDLKLFPYSPPGRNETQIPAQYLISVEQAAELGKAGFLTLSCAPDSDRALISTAPSVRNAPYYPDSDSYRVSLIQSSLAYQLLLGRIVNSLASATSHMGADESTGIETEMLEAFLRRLLSSTGEGASVSVRVEPHDSALYAIRLRTGNKVMRGVEVAFQLRGAGATD